MISKVKIIYILIGALLAPLFSSAQQIPQYNQYYINPFVYNPALCGYGDKTNAYFIRNQKYMGFDGGNVSNILTVDGKVFTDKFGLGLSLFNDQMGISNSLGAGLSFSYRVQFSEKTILGFGMSAGATDRRYDFGSVIVKDVNDPAYQVTFPARKTFFDASAGLYLDIDRFQIGVAVPQLLGNDLNYGTNSNHIIARHYIAHARYDWQVSEPLNLSVIPYAKVMFVPNAPLQYDFNVIADMKNLGWVGVGYRSNYALSMNLGVRIKKNLILGYAYNMVLNNTSAYGPMNQEILLGFTFGVKSNDKEKKQLEEANKEIERLKQELLRKQTETDSLIREKEKIEKDLREKMNEQETFYNDSINKLNEEIRRLKEERKNTDTKINEIKTDNKTPDRDPEIKRSTNDHFLELDKTTESPKGYYVISGAFGKMENAETQFNKLKTQFPEARIIYNERNGLHYILLTYSEEKPKVFDVHGKAKQAGESKAWILDYR